MPICFKLSVLRMIISLFVCIAFITDFSSVLGAELNFKFKTSKPGFTSAAAYTPEGKLVRTLWRKEKYKAGTHTVKWDGKDDAGNSAPTGKYEIRVISHNVNYVWDGVIGNTSKSFTENVWKSFINIQSMAASPKAMYCATGYNEGQEGFVKFTQKNPQARIPLHRADPFTSFCLVAADDTKSYWATDGHGIGGKKACFVMAMEHKTDKPYKFPRGKNIAINGNYEDQKYYGVIDSSQGSYKKAATGLAVQRKGNLLAVAHGSEDQILLYDKVSGALKTTIRDVPLDDMKDYKHAEEKNPQNQVSFSSKGDLWVLCGKEARRYTSLIKKPRVVATIKGFLDPLAIAAHPKKNDLVLISDGGSSQQIKAYDSKGKKLWQLGKEGGYASSPDVDNDRFKLNALLCVLSDGSFWVGDELNFRMLHFSAKRKLITSIAYLPHCYITTVDLNNPKRVFAKYQEYELDYTKPLTPGVKSSWRLVKNWAAGLSRKEAIGGWGGLKGVVTLKNNRTYAFDGKEIVELPQSGLLRKTGIRINGVLYADGSIRYSKRSGGKQIVYQKNLTGFDDSGNPQWGPDKELVSMPDRTGDPTYKGAFCGPYKKPRFPVTPSGVVISFDPGVQGNEGFHLGGAFKGTNEWLWKGSPTGWINGKGNFQTKRIDGKVTYGGNMVWSTGPHVVYGYHGEFWVSSPKGKPGQANKFMHFLEDGLFVGEFGVGTEYRDRGGKEESPAGIAGNSFSPVLVTVKGVPYLFHNDENSHAGIHRWRMEGADKIIKLSGIGTLGQNKSISLIKTKLKNL